MDEWWSLSPNQRHHWLSTVRPVVRTAYMYKPYANSGNYVNGTLYDHAFTRVAQLPAGSVVAMDVAYDAERIAHIDLGGWNLSFADGSVRFAKSQACIAYLVSQGSVGNSWGSYPERTGFREALRLLTD